MSDRAWVAAIQMDSGDDEGANFDAAAELARRARDRGAELIVLPENLLYEGSDKTRRHSLDEWEPRFSALASELGAFLVPGTIREPTADPARAHNTCLVYGPSGARLARYRKIHLFDVSVPNGPNELESSYIEPGDEPVVVELGELGRVGLSVCYDLRFPELYRTLTAQGARTVLIPSSFALGTGKDHWLTLLRARAIENQVFVLAPDQFGRKPHGPTKFGKTAIIDPWGTVLGQAPEQGSAVVLAELDFEHQDEVRRTLPCLAHRRR